MSEQSTTINHLDPELKTIGDLFINKDDEEPGDAYKIPIYQRNYSWKAEEIEQLLSDINDAFRKTHKPQTEEKNCYFLGNIIVTEQEKGSHIDYEVIDGQQRLTTLYLLLSFLSPGKINLQNALIYQSRPRATEALSRLNSSQKNSFSTQDLTSEDSGILEGYNIIQQFMDQHVQNQERVNFIKFLLNNVTVVRASLPSKTDFNRYFEIMNTRGQQLQQVDIVKARLMAHLDTDAERSCFAWIWDACSDMDSYVQMTLTRGKQEQRSVIFGHDWSWLCLDDFKRLTEINESTVEGRSSESLTLDKAIAKYASLKDSKEIKDQLNNRFRSIITFSTFLLHVLNVISSDPKEDEGQLDDKVLVQRFEEFINKNNQDKNSAIKKLAIELLRCRNIFDGYIIKRQYTATNNDDGDWSLQIFIKADQSTDNHAKNKNTYKNTFSSHPDSDEDGVIDKKTNELLLLQSMLRVTYTSPRTMYWITRVLRLLVDKKSNNVPEACLIDCLRNYSRWKVSSAFFKGDEPRGFNINRIVFTYLDYLLWKKSTSEEQSEFRFLFRNSIEHFYPQNLDTQQKDVEVSDECLDLLGNLALVSVGANSKFSNNLPVIKATKYPDIIQQSLKLKKMADIASKYGWSDKEVCAHHKEMVNILKDDIFG